MYIIPYFLENEAKKILKFKLSKIVDNIADSLINNIFNCNPDNKYQDLILSLDDNIRKSILNILKEVFSIFDSLYLNSQERKKYFNISNPKCHRSIFTIFGLLEFDRVYYYDKSDKNKHFYFVDSLFHLPAYDRYDKVVKGIAINNAISTNQKKGAEITNNQINSTLSYLENNTKCNITRQDIYLWIDKWNIPEIEYESIKTDDDILYIMIDEKYIHEQLKAITDNNCTNTNKNIDTKDNFDIKNYILGFINTLNNPPLLLPAPKQKNKHFIMSKAFITFTGIETKNKRRILQNKMTFLTTSKSPWDEFMNSISKIYDFKQYKTIKVLSDAGTWITSGISNLKLYVDNIIIPCLCEFHCKQKINRITKDELLRKLLNEAIDNDDKETFNQLIKITLKDKSEKRQKVIKSYKHYIIIHWDAIKEMKKSRYKSSMESHISHCVAKYFSFEPKAYSKRHIQKLIKLQEYKINGINILGLYLKTSDYKEKKTIKKEELTFSIFESNSSNVPLLYNNDSLTRLALRGLSA